MNAENEFTFFRRAAAQGQLLATSTPIIFAFDVYRAEANLNCSRTTFTSHYINAPKNCFDNKRRNECKHGAPSFKSHANLVSMFYLFYSMTREKYTGPLGIIWLDKLILYSLIEHLNFDGPTKRSALAKGNKKRLFPGTSKKKRLSTKGDFMKMVDEICRGSIDRIH